MDFEAVTQLDLTGAYALGETRETLEREGVRLVIARPHGLVREQMERTGVLASIGAENIQPTVREALAAAVELPMPPHRDKRPRRSPMPHVLHDAGLSAGDDPLRVSSAFHGGRNPSPAGQWLRLLTVSCTDTAGPTLVGGRVRTPIRNPPDPMYAEIEVHRTMICDRVRTEAFRRAIDAMVRPGDVVLDVGAGTGILSLFAARAGAARVYAVEQTTIAVLARELAAANGVADVVHVIQGDIMEVELPERVDVIVSEWLGGFGIDEGMLVPVIVARDRWLKLGGIMIPRSVTAWTGLVHDSHLGETTGFLSDNPYGLRLDGLVEMTLNEVIYSGSFRHLAEGDRRSEQGRLWTTDVMRISLEQAQAPQEAEVLLQVRDSGTANALALWFSADLAPERLSR